MLKQQASLHRPGSAHRHLAVPRRQLQMALRLRQAPRSPSANVAASACATRTACHHLLQRMAALRGGRAQAHPPSAAKALMAKPAHSTKGHAGVQALRRHGHHLAFCSVSQRMVTDAVALAVAAAAMAANAAAARVMTAATVTAMSAEIVRLVLHTVAASAASELEAQAGVHFTTHIDTGLRGGKRTRAATRRRRWTCARSCGSASGPRRGTLSGATALWSQACRGAALKICAGAVAAGARAAAPQQAAQSRVSPVQALKRQKCAAEAALRRPQRCCAASAITVALPSARDQVLRDGAPCARP